ncbi:MAG: PqqD family protein [Deltaproteobacteria bacterium]|nr:PqqD family protein [Deltaproteobacteria bacterium]
MSYSLSKEYVWKEVGDQVVVLHIETGRYYSLNHPGSLIWKGLMEGLSLDRIIEQLRSIFDVDKPNAKKDSEEMIRDLLTKEAIINDQPL